MLVDDHPMVLAGVQQMLDTAGDIRVVAQAQDAQEAMSALATDNPDVAVIDISLPDESGLSLLQRIKRTAPHVAVLMLSGYGEDMYALRALRAGADGYLTKGAPMNEVISAVRRVADGGKHFSSTLNELLVRQIQGGKEKGHESLTPREFDIMMRLAAGESTGSIAAQLHRSPKTVSTHRARLFEKLNVQSNAQLARYVMEQGLIGPATNNN